MTKDIILYNIKYGETESVTWYDHLRKEFYQEAIQSNKRIPSIFWNI